MSDEIITMLVRVPRWTAGEITAVCAATRFATWREADRRPLEGSTDVSLDVEASTDAEARQLARAALGDLHPDAFLASTV